MRVEEATTVAGVTTVLRAVLRPDLPLLRDIYNHPSVAASVVGDGRPVSIEEHERWYRRIESGQAAKQYFVIVERASGRAVGLVSVEDHDRERRTAAGSIKLHPSAMGRGLATDAVQARDVWAFRELGLDRIEALVLETNDASRRLHERVGYRLEGGMGALVVRDGQRIDVLRYARLAVDAERDPATAPYRRAASEAVRADDGDVVGNR